MKTYIETIKRKHFVSSVYPDIDVTDAGYVPVIEWADATPNAWDVVRENRSAPWGRKSSEYMGCGHGESAEDVCYRAGHFMNYVTLGRASKLHGKSGDDFFGWRARFTLTHYKDKGFRGGFFQQWDGEYTRGCHDLDYTPKTLDEVINRFVEHCRFDRPDFVTREVWINKKPVRVYTEVA
jgi:hypothetical protein